MGKTLRNLLIAASVFALGACSGGGSSEKGGEDGGAIPAKPFITNTLPYHVEPSRGIQLDIQDNSDNENGFVLERKTSNGTFTNLKNFAAISGTGTFMYNDLGVDKSTTYIYRIKAYNQEGDSDWEEKTETSEDTLTSLIKVRPTKDAYVAKTYYPDMNFGNANNIYISNWTNPSETEMGFLYFPLPTLPHYSKGFHSAILKMVESGGGNTFYPGPIGVYASPIASDWNEGSITYNNAPGWWNINSYGSHNPNLITDRQLNIDVSITVNSWYAGTLQNKGFALYTTDTDRYCAYYSREFSTTSEAVPILEVNYRW